MPTPWLKKDPFMSMWLIAALISCVTSSDAH
ncbi:hypothetical protein J2W49_002079 [Hydrogenophaga palleronii]|uniref:Uncharacterized protein n=1 Tax=Hydrogenophaga palleronii TaxID=65655 RepID=A0ABU1WM74_9BURK|nr:hypothetical protein [Hydrogenophaga palleronii]